MALAGNPPCMGSRRRGARWERREFRRLTKDLDFSAVSGFDRPHRPRRHPAKDFLGAAVSLAIIGVFVLQLTDAAARRCEAGPKSRTSPGSCSGAAAVAHHAQPVVTLSFAACAVLAVVAFVWYLLWGYKTNGQAGGTEPTLRS